MIDPQNITNYSRTEHELQEFFLFGIAVANKNARRTAKAFDVFLDKLGFKILNPFSRIRIFVWCHEIKGLANILKECGIAPYNQKANTMYSLACKLQSYKLTDTEPELIMEKVIEVKGIGMKTATFVLTHSFVDFEMPVLDTHILKWLASQGVRNVPKSTPGNKSRYFELSNEFIRLKPNDKSVAEFDLEIWRKYSK